MNIINFENTNKEEFILDFYDILDLETIHLLEYNEEAVAFGVEVDDEKVAVICGAPHENAMELLYLFVEEPYRLQGIATTLLRQFYWATFSCLSVDHMHTTYQLLETETLVALKETLSKNGYHFYIPNPNKENFECDVCDLVPQTNINPDVISFAEMGIGFQDKLVKLLNTEVGSTGNKIPESTEMNLSQVFIKNGEILAFFWIEQFNETLFRVAALYGSGDVHLISAVMSASIAKAKEQLSPDTVILCDLYEGVGKKALTHMTGGKLRHSTRSVHAFSTL